MPGSEDIYNFVDLLQRCTNQIMSNCRMICEIVCMKSFHSVSADYQWEKSRITAYVKMKKNVMNNRRLMIYLRDREVVAMLDYDSSRRIGFLVPCTHEDGIGF